MHLLHSKLPPFTAACNEFKIKRRAELFARLVCIFYALQALCCCSAARGMQCRSASREEICIFCITRGGSDALIRHGDNNQPEQEKRNTKSQRYAHLHDTRNLECARANFATGKIHPINIAKGHLTDLKLLLN
jgi:hypothetical protein